MTDLIDELATESLTVKRYAPGSWDTGRFVRGAESSVTFTASVQQLTPNETEQLPEHKRNKESIKIYTSERLFQADEKTQTPADIVTHDGKEYEVQKVGNWQIGTDLPHYKAIAVLHDGEGSGGH